MVDALSYFSFQPVLHDWYVLFYLWDDNMFVYLFVCFVVVYRDVANSDTSVFPTVLH